MSPDESLRAELRRECIRLASALTAEAQLWQGRRRAELMHAAIQMGYVTRAAYTKPIAEIESLVEAAITVLDAALIQRARIEYFAEVSRG